MAWTYILRCRDGSFYAGSTTELDARVAQWLCQLDLAPVRRLDLAPVRGRRTLGPDCGAFGSEDDDGGA